MTWSDIIAAAAGRPKALDEVICRSRDDDVAVLKTLLLLEETPHPAAALVAAATVRKNLAAPIQAALAPHGAPALAAWRADPQWDVRVFGAAVTKQWFVQGVAGMVGALHELPAALHDAVAIVRRDGDSSDVGLCLEALGALGWSSLDADLRAALLKKAPAAAHGRVWAALDDAQRAAATDLAKLLADSAALIGRIGAAAWRATDPALRKRLIDAAVARMLHWVHETAPAWPGMTDDERETLARAEIEHGDAESAFTLLKDLGAAGRGALTAAQRAALDARAMEGDAMSVWAWRAADAGWGAVSAKERRALLATMTLAVWYIPNVLRAVGAAGWAAMSAAEQARIAGAVRRAPDVFFRCPPTLWIALGGDDPPPPRAMPRDAADHWNAEDADADLGALPPAHQALVLALAPWRWKDAARDPVRVRRLLAAWDALPDDERVALATAAPGVLPSVAAAARLRGGAAAGVDAVGETLIRIVLATGGAADARQAAGRLIRVAPRWRNWMASFAPTDGDPPEAWEAWEVAVRRGIIADVTLCARLAAKEREAGAPARALRRA